MWGGGGGGGGGQLPLFGMNNNIIFNLIKYFPSRGIVYLKHRHHIYSALSPNWTLCMEFGRSQNQYYAGI